MIEYFIKWDLGAKNAVAWHSDLWLNSPRVLMVLLSAFQFHGHSHSMKLHHIQYIFNFSSIKNSVVFSWALTNASVTRVELEDLRIFSNRQGKIRVFVRPKLPVLPWGWRMHSEKYQKEQTCSKMLSRFAYEPRQKVTFPLLNRKESEAIFCVEIWNHSVLSFLCCSHVLLTCIL